MNFAILKNLVLLRVLDPLKVFNLLRNVPYTLLDIHYMVDKALLLLSLILNPALVKMVYSSNKFLRITEEYS